jgi:hypothetical protein
MLKLKAPTQQQKKLCPDDLKGTELEGRPEEWHHMTIENKEKGIKYTACSIGRDKLIDPLKLWSRTEFDTLPKSLRCKECNHHLYTGGIYVKRI